MTIRFLYLYHSQNSGARTLALREVTITKRHADSVWFRCVGLILQFVRFLQKCTKMQELCGSELYDAQCAIITDYRGIDCRNNDGKRKWKKHRDPFFTFRLTHRYARCDSCRTRGRKGGRPPANFVNFRLRPGNYAPSFPLCAFRENAVLSSRKAPSPAKRAGTPLFDAETCRHR